jgi:hypothetical protein
MAVFSQGIFHHGCKGLHLLCTRNDLLADRVIWVLRIDQRDEVRGHIHAEQAAGLECFALALGQRDDLFYFLDRIQAMAQLPAPVVPLFIRNVGVDWGAFRKDWAGHGLLLREIFNYVRLK